MINTDGFFIFCAQYLFIASFAISVICFFRLNLKDQIRLAILGLISGLFSYAAALLAGQLYFDPRPFVEGHFKPLITHDTENGFPSDHVLMLSVIAAVWTFYTRKFWTLVLWIIAVLVAYSRVYVGVHHYIDVFVSMAIAAIISSLVFYILKGNWLESITQRIETIIRVSIFQRFSGRRS